MDSNDIINQALGAHGNAMLGGNELYVLEGHSECNELRVIPLDEAYKNNLMGFTYSINNGFLMLGIFNSKEAAEESIEIIRTLIKDEQGNRLRPLLSRF